MLTIHRVQNKWALTDPTYIFIEGAHGLLVQRVQVLQRSCGKPHNEVEPICTPGDKVEIMTDGNGWGLVDSLVNRFLQVRYLHGYE